VFFVPQIRSLLLQQTIYNILNYIKIILLTKNKNEYILISNSRRPGPSLPVPLFGKLGPEIPIGGIELKELYKKDAIIRFSKKQGTRRPNTIES
jgi:hypothetical protein